MNRMGLLDHLWDDTLAGPPPDTGLGRLRRSYTFSPSSLAAAAPPSPLQVTRSITILRSNSCSSGGASPPPTPSSVASSPRGPSDSPLSSPTPRGDWKRLRRKPTSAAAEAAEPRSPTVYDWVVISALDR